MSTTKPQDISIQYLERLSKAGFEDVLTLRRETAERVLTEKRVELVEVIVSGDIESVRDLARTVDRDVSIVSRDLDVLYEADVIEFEEEGAAKRPVIAHENIFIKPLVLEGQVFDE